VRLRVLGLSASAIARELGLTSITVERALQRPEVVAHLAYLLDRLDDEVINALVYSSIADGVGAQKPGKRRYRKRRLTE
jgi:hypothetical protein